MSGDDLLLVRRCLRGDATAMERLVQQYQADVFGLSVRLLQHRQDAEDVTQEVFIRVFRSLRRWDSRRPLKPWIMGITVNRCRTWISQRSRRPELIEYLHETPARDDGESAAELAREIQAAVQDMRWDYQTVFVLFHERGLAYDDIARAIRKPVGTVKTWLHRARLEVLDRLRKRGMISEVGYELP